jgi:hypothetical protein
MTYVMPDSSHDIRHVWFFIWHSHACFFTWHTSCLTLHTTYVMSDSSHDIRHAWLFTWHTSCLSLHTTYVMSDSSYDIVMPVFSHDVRHVWLFTRHTSCLTLHMTHVQHTLARIFPYPSRHEAVCTGNLNLPIRNLILRGKPHRSFQTKFIC